VEDVVTTADELFRRVEDEGRADSATREALRYRAALLEGFRSIQARPLGLGTARHVCSRIKDADMDVRRVPGVRIGNPRTGQVVYPPPTDPAILGELVSNWEAFLHAKDDLDPLVRMAVAHYQFEAIHPFTDGNGRTGRVLNSLFLVERGLIGAPILYLSRYVIDHKAEYYDRLLGVTREGAWEPWILFVVEAVEETSRWTLHKVEAIARLHGATRDFLRAGLPRIYSAELVEELFLRPYCRIRHLVAAGLGGRQTASRHLKALAEVGILVEQQEGRDKVFVQPRLLRLLTTEAHDFAALD